MSNLPIAPVPSLLLFLTTAGIVTFQVITCMEFYAFEANQKQAQPNFLLFKELSTRIVIIA